ncbi:MAG: TSUP family transporter [Pseudomonadota bacterium]
MPLLPPELEPLSLALNTGASFLTSLMTAAFGLGGGVTLLAVLALLLPPAALIPVHGLVQLASNAGRAALMRREAARGPLLPFLGGAALGAALGGVAAVDLPGAWVELGVGGFVIWAALGRAPAAVSRFAGAAGFVSTLLTMFFGATGPFVAAYVRTLELGRAAHVATTAVMMTAQHALKVVAFGLLGFAFGPWLVPVAAMAAAGFLGTLAGRRLLMRGSEARFRRVLTVLLVLLGARLVATGLWEIAGG